MKRRGFCVFEPELLNDGVLASVDLPLEVSLDCPVCQRRRRTVLFAALNSPGLCPYGRHEFGWWVSVTVSPGAVRLEFDYDYVPFVDAKHTTNEDTYAPYAGREKGAPTWVRFRYWVQCGCGLRRRYLSDENAQCGCGRRVLASGEARLGWFELPISGTSE